MMKQDRQSGFWEQGFSIFADELGKEESRRLADLKKQFQEAGTAEQKQQIKRLMAEIRAEFRQKRKNAQYSLFACQGTGGHGLTIDEQPIDDWRRGRAVRETLSSTLTTKLTTKGKRRD